MLLEDFEKGLRLFRTPLYVHPHGLPYILADKPYCERDKEIYQTRLMNRQQLSPQDKVADIRRHGFLSEPTVGYNRFCTCRSCRIAYMTTFFKGLLGKPSTGLSQVNIDPEFTGVKVEATLQEFTKRVQLATARGGETSKFLAQVKHGDIDLNETLGLVKEPMSVFQAIQFSLVYTLWRRGLELKNGFYPQSLEGDRSVVHQPSWASISGVPEVAHFASYDSTQMKDDLLNRELTFFSFFGPLSEAQRNMVFGLIRDCSDRSGVVVVNTDNHELIGLVSEYRKYRFG